jgi:DNA-binding IclR family transcriptional regulator
MKRSAMALKQKTKPDSTAGVTAVARALRLLECFQPDIASLTLAQLSLRTALHKTTTLRLARTLERDGYLVQRESGEWRLGPSAGRLGAHYQASFDVNHEVENALRKLAHNTRESAALYVREAHVRICIQRVEGPQAVRHHVRVGAQFPLNRGAAGKVILAYSGESGAAFDEIRAKGFGLSQGERERDVGSVAAPVFGGRNALIGAVCISGPMSRLSQLRLNQHAKAVQHTARALSGVFAHSQLQDLPRIVVGNPWFVLSGGT